ncbi:hypothetical protein [Streptomyces sp. NPDC126522]|uniref:hypothetical protein n=1 Tax=Streptomyces sp. NPDC126522 TaxID=3155211 RepID=UPI00332D2530
MATVGGQGGEGGQVRSGPVSQNMPPARNRRPAGSTDLRPRRRLSREGELRDGHHHRGHRQEGEGALERAAPEDELKELQLYEGESEGGHELAQERDRASAEAAQDEQARVKDRTATAQSEHDAAGQRERGDGERAEVRLAHHRGHFAPALD